MLTNPETYILGPSLTRSLDEEWYELSRMKRLKKRYGKLGSIEVRVFRTGYGKEGGDTEAKPDGFISRDGIELPEETVKAGRKTTLGTW